MIKIIIYVARAYSFVAGKNLSFDEVKEKISGIGVKFEVDEKVKESEKN